MERVQIYPPQTHYTGGVMWLENRVHGKAQIVTLRCDARPTDQTKLFCTAGWVCLVSLETWVMQTSPFLSCCAELGLWFLSSAWVTRANKHAPYNSLQHCTRNSCTVHMSNFDAKVFSGPNLNAELTFILFSQYVCRMQKCAYYIYALAPEFPLGSIKYLYCIVFYLSILFYIGLVELRNTLKRKTTIQ